MSIICTICQDLVTQIPEGAAAAGFAEVNIVALQCGHLFHRCCVEGWFHRQRPTDVGECPYCKKESKLSAGLRIWLSGDAENDHKLFMANSVCQENMELRNEMSQIRNILEETGAELEIERSSSNLIKYEYEQNVTKLSELESKYRALAEELEILQSTTESTIADLKAEYLAKIHTLEKDVQLNQQLKDVLKEFSSVVESNRVKQYAQGDPAQLQSDPFNRPSIVVALESVVKSLNAGNQQILQSFKNAPEATNSAQQDFNTEPFNTVRMSLIQNEDVLIEETEPENTATGSLYFKSYKIIHNNKTSF